MTPRPRTTICGSHKGLYIIDDASEIDDIRKVALALIGSVELKIELPGQHGLMMTMEYSYTMESWNSSLINGLDKGSEVLSKLLGQSVEGNFLRQESEKLFTLDDLDFNDFLSIWSYLQISFAWPPQCNKLMQKQSTIVDGRLATQMAISWQIRVDICQSRLSGKM
uniref:SFRICE_032339 n=1 Tax=Spodoptera frugiperda TaxID=7108 RepID=A0A2H1VYA2_SPOFR